MNVDVSNLSAVDGWWLDGGRAEEYANREGTRLIATLPRPRTVADGPFYMPGIEHIGERRSKDEFRLEVTAYTAQILDRWPSIVAGHHVEENDPHIVPLLRNDTENNYEDVVLEVTFPPGAHRVFPSARAAVGALNLPEPPDDWGHLDLVSPSLWAEHRPSELASRAPRSKGRPTNQSWSRSRRCECAHSLNTHFNRSG